MTNELPEVLDRARWRQRETRPAAGFDPRQLAYTDAGLGERQRDGDAVDDRGVPDGQPVLMGEQQCRKGTCRDDNVRARMDQRLDEGTETLKQAYVRLAVAGES